VHLEKCNQGFDPVIKAFFIAAEDRKKQEGIF